jgi:hypothetical protein
LPLLREDKWIGMVDPPLTPDDKPSPAEMADLASRLLAELSRDDPRIAAKVRELGSLPSRTRSQRPRR